MRKPTRDAVLVIGLFLLATGLLVAWIADFASLKWLVEDWQRGGVLCVVVCYGLTILGFLGLNLMAIRRGELRWYREPVISLIILFIIFSILVPVLFQARDSWA